MKALLRQHVSLLFNQTCLNERLLPKCKYFKTHGLAAHDDDDTRKNRYSLVKRQINNCLLIGIILR